MDWLLGRPLPSERREEKLTALTSAVEEAVERSTRAHKDYVSAVRFTLEQVVDQSRRIQKLNEATQHAKQAK